ncbi:MAG: DUF6495 family protein [Crocinitomicaceae bacterium]
MQKYRALSKSELIEFKDEFISFLVINGIEADDWQKLKDSDQQKAEKIIDHFSEVIFEGIFRKNMYLEFVSAKSMKCFQFLQEKAILVGLDAKSDSKINFLGEQSLDSIILNNSNGVEVYHTSKTYSKTREEEMFDMLSSGARLSKGRLFKQISLLL